MSRVMEAKIKSVVVANRHRKDLGDLEPLIESVRELGVLQPIVCRVVDERLHLVAGERRLEAARRLGHALVPTVVVKNLDTATKALLAERDENTCRKPMTPIELKSLTDELLALEQEEAKARQREGGARGGRAEGCAPQSTTLPSHKNKAKAKAADAAGWSRASYERTTRAVEVAKNESLPESVRQVARDCVEKLEAGEMAPTGADKAIREAMLEAGVGSTTDKIDKAKRNNPPSSNGTGKSRAEVEQKVATYKRMADEGYTTRQIAPAIGVGLASMWSFRKRQGLDAPPADEIVGKTRHHDSNRIVEQTVIELEGTAFALGLVDLEELDRDQFDYWVSSLSESIKSITTLKNQLKKELTQ